MQKSCHSLLTCRTDAFEADLLASDQETLVGAVCQGNGEVCQAVGLAALRTGKMWVALRFAAVVRQFVMAGSFLQEDFVHQISLGQTVQRTVDGDPVERVIQGLGDLLLRDRTIRVQKRLDDTQTGLGAVQPGSFQHVFGLRIQGVHSESLWVSRDVL